MHSPSAQALPSQFARVHPEIALKLQPRSAESQQRGATRQESRITRTSRQYKKSMTLFFVAVLLGENFAFWNSTSAPKTSETISDNTSFPALAPGCQRQTQNRHRDAWSMTNINQRKSTNIKQTTWLYCWLCQLKSD